MRPVYRGDHPQIDGKDIKFKTYQEARPYLEVRIGFYCSYCEMPCNQGPALEHVHPKSLRKDLELTWSNFLLGCNRCNGIKKDTDVSLKDYYWPDKDNTYRAFEYVRDREPIVKISLTDKQKKIAENTLDLTGLNRRPGHSKWNPNDKRFIHRRTAWSKALESRSNLEVAPSEQMRNQIVLTATSTGFWSIWMKVFEGNQEMQKRFIIAFKGTSGIGECFKNDMKPFKRKSGKL